MILLPPPRLYARELKDLSLIGDYEILAEGCKEAFWRMINFVGVLLCPRTYGITYGTDKQASTKVP